MHYNSISTILERVIEIAKEKADVDLEKWAHLELEGYYSTNRYLTEQDVVPAYREVAGEHRDVYGRPLLIEDPRLSFVNTDRLRMAVSELEAAANKEGLMKVRDPQRAKIIKEALGVDVCEFVFNPIGFKGVLTSIKEEAIRRAEKYVTRIELLSGNPSKQKILESSSAKESLLMTMTDKKNNGASQNGTLGWLWHNLPITVWFKFLGILIFVFMLGLYVSGIPIVKNVLSYIPGYKAQLLLPPETSKTVQITVTELTNKHSERIAQLQSSIVRLRESAAAPYAHAYDYEKQAEEINKLIGQECANFEKELKLLKALLEK
jgi:AbiTii